MTIASLRTHSDAVLAKLVAAFAATPTIIVCDGEVPDTVGWPAPPSVPGQSIFVPYVVLYPLGAEFDGPIGDNAYDDADFRYQVTCVGESRQQAEGLTDVTIAALVGATLTVTGRAVTHITLSDDAASMVRADTTVKPLVFMSTPRFSVYSCPA